MKEHPILMQGEMVRATLDDRKSQIRRLIKLREFGPSDTSGYDWQFRDKHALWNDVSTERLLEKYCPYGQPGDLLWVRETWAPWKGILCPCSGDCNCDPFLYRADPDTDFANKCEYPNEQIRWKPSIFMPKRAARIWRRITDIRVERVQDISIEDAIAEGLESEFDSSGRRWCKLCGSWRKLDQWTKDPRWAFETLWDSINAKPKLAKRPPWTLAPEDCYVSYPWEDIQETREHRELPWYVIGNPWVWALSYEKANR